jgi:hypothetical protein
MMNDTSVWIDRRQGRAYAVYRPPTGGVYRVCVRMHAMDCPWAALARATSELLNTVKW